jgi:competence transcription factor ComK
MANIDLNFQKVTIAGSAEEKKSLGISNHRGSKKLIVVTDIIQKDSSIITSSIFLRKNGIDLVVRGLNKPPITVDESIIFPGTMISKPGESIFLEEGDELFATVGKDGSTEFKIKYFIFS